MCPISQEKTSSLNPVAEEMVNNKQKNLAIQLNSYCLCLHVLFKENSDYYIYVSLLIMTVNKIQ